jgi:hypothetical protein
MKTTFEYWDWPHPSCGHADFVMQVPLGIRSTAGLLEVLSEVGEFPGYFGFNWDALQDFMLDFSWISNRNLVIVHGDIPLRQEPSECRIYLEILQTALEEIAGTSNPNAIEPPPEWPYVEHELRVIFPADAREIILSLLEVPQK